MKKIFILTFCLCSALMLTAQVRVDHHEGVETFLAPLPYVTMERPGAGVLDADILDAFVRQDEPEPVRTIAPSRSYVDFVSRAARVKRHNMLESVAQDTLQALYAIPDGTFYLGIDKIGYGIHFVLPGVIGAWRQGVDAWTWKNLSKGADSITWKSYFLDGETYYYGHIYDIDQDKNLIDSMVVSGRGSTRYYRNYSTPILFAHSVADGVVQRADTFMVNEPISHEIDTLQTDSWVLGGSLSPYTAYDPMGLWPLTAAKPFLFMPNAIEGQPDPQLREREPNRQVVTTDTAGNSVFVYGTDMRQLYSFDDSSFVDAPYINKLTTYYKKPQAPLYVRDISMSIAGRPRQRTVFGSTSVTWSTPVLVDTLTLRVLDKSGNVLATSTCSDADATTNYRLSGKMLNFKFETRDEFGMMLSEGIVLKDEFSIEIEGLYAATLDTVTNQTVNGNEFGIYAAYDPYEGGHAVLTGIDGKQYFDAYDPYVMLNGVFNTLETTQDTNLDTLYVPMRMRYINPTWSAPYYLCVIDTGQYQNYVPSIYSTTPLIDSLSGFINLDVKGPEWASYESSIAYDDYGFYPFYIYDNEGKGRAGDEIVISKFGKTIVFQIVNDDATTALHPVKANLSTITRQGEAFVITYPPTFRSMQMLDASGRLIDRRELSESGVVRIEASSLPQGVYVFRMQGQGNAEILRAVK